MRAITLMLATCLFAVPVAAQNTRPAEDLAKENTELKKRIEMLEAYVAKLEAKVQAAKPAAPRADATPRFRPAPYGFELPSPPFQLPRAPAPAPKLPELRPVPPNTMPIVPPPSRYNVPESWKKRQFNGTEYYLVPLE